MSFWGPFEFVEALQIWLFFHFFVDGRFGRHFPNFQRKGIPKGVPKGTILRPLGRTGGNVKTLLSCRRNHCFEVWRGSWETSCEALCAQCFPTCFSERFLLCFLTIWAAIGGPLPTLGGNFFLIWGILFQRSISSWFWIQFGGGSAAEVGLSIMQNMQKFWGGSCHARLPLRGAASLKAAASAADPSSFLARNMLSPRRHGWLAGWLASGSMGFSQLNGPKRIYICIYMYGFQRISVGKTLNREFDLCSLVKHSNVKIEL